MLSLPLRPLAQAWLVLGESVKAWPGQLSEGVVTEYRGGVDTLSHGLHRTTFIKYTNSLPITRLDRGSDIPGPLLAPLRPRLPAVEGHGGRGHLHWPWDSNWK